jgi:hypothetical protein
MDNDFWYVWISFTHDFDYKKLVKPKHLLIIKTEEGVADGV